MSNDVAGPDGSALSEGLGPTLELMNRVLPCNPPWGPGQYVNVERVGLLLAEDRNRREKRGSEFSAELGAWGRDDLMALAAVRYCLGRMSYIVGDCCKWLPSVWPHLKPSMQTIIARDIDEAIRRDTEARARGDEHLPLGMDCDRAEWVRMQHLWKAPNAELTGTPGSY